MDKTEIELEITLQQNLFLSATGYTQEFLNISHLNE